MVLYKIYYFGRYPSLTTPEIILIFLAALTYLGIDSVDDIKKIRDIIKEKGLQAYLNQTVTTLKDIENVALKVVAKSGFALTSLAEIIGYVFLLVPILDAFQKINKSRRF